MARLLYDYTSGYPFLVSRLCKLIDYPSLEKIVYKILFAGERMVYNPDDTDVDIAQMFGFAKNDNGNIAIAKSQYIKDGRLGFEQIMDL